MNFLDAHNIVHQIGGALGRGNLHKDDFFRPLSFMPFEYDKDKIVAAFQIFFAHMVLFQTRTPEQYEQYQAVYMSLNTFIPDEEILRIRKATQLAIKKGLLNKLFYGSKIKDAQKVYADAVSKWTGAGYYRLDDISNHTASMQEFRKIVVADLSKNKDIDTDYIIEVYAKKAYELAEIEYRDEYFYFFHPFDSMRKAIRLPQFNDYYVGYEEYINSNK